MVLATNVSKCWINCHDNHLRFPRRRNVRVHLKKVFLILVDLRAQCYVSEIWISPSRPVSCRCLSRATLIYWRVVVVTITIYKVTFLIFNFDGKLDSRYFRYCRSLDRRWSYDLHVINVLTHRFFNFGNLPFKIKKTCN